MHADILIVGGGVVGALMAWQLAEAGRHVLVIEAGSRVDRLTAVGQFATAGGRGLDKPYRTLEGDRFAPFAEPMKKLGDHEFLSTWLRRLGGSTWHWQGSTPRMIPSDFALATLYGRGVDWPISYDELEPWYGRAEEALGVSGDHDEWQEVLGARRSAPFPMPPIWPTWSDRRFKARVEGLDIGGHRVEVRLVPQARNSQPYQGRPPCAGNSSCVPLCPIGAKYDATVHLDLAGVAGAIVRDRCVARRILGVGRGITGIEVVDWSTGAPSVETLTANVYVLAAHTIETARLLLVSDVATESGTVGHFVMDHPGSSIAGLAPEPWFPFRGPPVTSGIDAWRDGPFRTEHSAWRFSLGNDGQGRARSTEAFVKQALQEGLIGAELRERIEREGTRLFRISWATEQLPDEANHLQLLPDVDALGIPKVGIHYRVGDYVFRAFPPIRDVVRALFDRADITEPRGGDETQWTGSGHVLGTCRMGREPRTSVVDRDCRAHAYDNLFVVGGAVFPTVGTANPTLTVAALALRAAGVLATL